MKRYLVIIILISKSVWCYGQFSRKCACNAIISSDYKGEVEVFKSLDRFEKISLHHDVKDENFLVLSLIRDSANYFYVDMSLALTKNSSTKGWIKKWDYIGTFARNYAPGDTLRLYSTPDVHSMVGAVIPEWASVLYKIEKCSGEWVFVRLNYKGRDYSGWMQPDRQCANPNGNCN